LEKGHKAEAFSKKRPKKIVLRPLRLQTLRDWRSEVLYEILI